MKEEFISCVCMTCGIRNDHTNENGFCQNGHDNWLEYRDVIDENEWFLLAMHIFKISAEDLTKQFMDSTKLQFEVNQEQINKALL